MKFILLIATIITTSAFPRADKLIGRWESMSKAGNVTGVIFKTDNTFEAYVNKKPFVTGTYTYQDNVFSFIDNGCNGMRGTYTTNFFSNSDSMRFELVSDSCMQRRNGMISLVLGRVK